MILLASQSPRRKQLLGQYISSSFLTYVPSIDEDKDEMIRKDTEKDIFWQHLRKTISLAFSFSNLFCLDEKPGSAAVTQLLRVKSALA